MNFNNVWYEVVASEGDKEVLKNEAANMTAKEMCKTHNVSESKLRQVLNLYGIRPKTPDRAKIRNPVSNWARTFNGGKLISVYYDMLKRCHDSKNKGYEKYGAKGIYVCEEWRSNCSNFYKWAKENGYKEGLTIDRIDNNKGYSPDNCRWTTWKVQTVNRRNTRWILFNGEKKTLKEWSEELNISYQVLADRIYRYGWSIERALTTPVNLV